MKLKGELLNIKDLSIKIRSELFQLYSTYFENALYNVFMDDLNEKDWIIILKESETKKIKGFSTQMLMQQNIDSKIYKALFSGDTIIEKNYWGETELMRVWGKLAIYLIEKYPNDNLYWFLISMGYKTYRFLPLFFKSYYPSYNDYSTNNLKDILDRFAFAKFPKEYSPLKGIINLNGTSVFLKKGVADISDNLLKNKHIQFFIKKNPYYYKGDELACITRLSKDNFTIQAMKIINSKRIYF